ncbi:MAG TPA: M6 family metalloprotease domain-containing protein [Methylomirabilota bacterium]|nr:M6 family metalloprotease domain-containing protein [Methylomirabilota bacterium]
MGAHAVRVARGLALTARRRVTAGLGALVVAVLALVPAAFAAPANDNPFVLHQPDGTPFGARLYGDEWVNGAETVDGYTIVKDEVSGYWTYADTTPTGGLAPTGYVVGRDLPYALPPGLRPVVTGPHPSAPAQLGAVPQAVVGSRRLLVILVKFTNRSEQTTAAAWRSRIFGATGSVKHFYAATSYSALNVVPATESHGTANDGIVGWLTLPYAHPDFGRDWSAGAQQLAQDAMTAANPYVNFAAYDTNHDGFISASELMVVVVVAGNETSFGGACTPSIWAHRWSTHGATLDGVTLSPYAMFGEMHCSSGAPPGAQATVGIMVHEIGHLLGLPDLYDIDNSSEGVGRWSVMSTGSWNGTNRAGDSPSLMDAWSKYVLGWVTPTQVTGTLAHQPVAAATTASTVYKFGTGSPTTGGEYYLVENRQLMGYDTGLPGSGLLIWHVDEAKWTNEDECYPGSAIPCGSTTHYKLALVQADNDYGLEKKTNRGDAGDPFPGTSGRRAFTTTTTPGSRWYSGASSRMSVTEIGDPAATMTATFALETLFSVSGTVRAAGVGLGGVTLTFTRVSGTGALPAPVLTTATGTWTRGGFQSGTTYRVTPTRPGVVFTPTSLQFSAASSSLNFTSATKITVTAPDGGETWGIGGLYTIRWTSASLTGNVNVYLSRNPTALTPTWTLLVGNTANDGAHPWTVTGTVATPARIRVCSVTVPAICDDSNANFTIAPRTVTVTAPNGAEVWPIGSSQTIRWTAPAVTGNVNIYLSRNASATMPTWTLIIGNTPNDGAQAWTVTGPASTQARVKICSVTAPVVCDTSGASFTIRGVVRVTAPNGGERWPIGVVRRITWTSSVPGNVTIAVSRDGGVNWAAIVTNTANDTAHDWTVTGPFTTQARIRVCGVSLPAICDMSNANFTIGVADLVATVLDVPNPAFRLNPWQAHLTLSNAGSAPAPASRADIYIATGSPVTTANTFLVSFSVPALAAGQTVTVHSSPSFLFPLTVIPGTYHVAVRLDATNAVPETNESNMYQANFILAVF